MNLKALITTALVVGSSTVAFAHPREESVDVRDHRATTVAARGDLDVRFNAGLQFGRVDRDRDRDRDHRRPVFRPRPIFIPAIEAQPVDMGYGEYGYQPAGPYTVASFGYAFNGTQVVNLGWGREATLLRIVASDPNSEVASVTVHYGDGTQHTYLWNHIFGSATDGQRGPNLDMGFPAGTIIRSIDVNAINPSNAPLMVQLQG